MLELRGKYNTAKVFTDNIDDTTVGQVIQLMSMPYAEDYTTRIMPDCHAGKGCVVGTTIKFNNFIVPNLVGVDIGCGMYAIKLEEKEIDLEKLDEVINEYIPSGFNIHKHPVETFDSLKAINAPIDIDRANCSLGSLGGGNHFIELNRDAHDNLWLVIHSGSRHLGLEICEFYQKQAIKYVRENKDSVKDLIATLKEQGREKEIQQAIMERKNKYVPDELCYLERNTNGLYEKYLLDMNIAANFAQLNRSTIYSIIMDKMGWEPPLEGFATVHNYINLGEKMIRKGAVSANKGEKLIIPMNMRDGSLICVGKGNPKWNNSAPHGAGRILSRGQAKDKLSMKEFKDTMKGIYSSSVLSSTLDESPMAYKPMQEIINNIGDTVDVIDVIKPIYNFKAH